IRDFHVTGVQTCALPICPIGFVTSGSSPTPNFTVTGLTAGTIYTIYIRTSCGATDKSIYSTYQFVHAPTPIPYTQDFEGANPARSEERRVGKENSTDMIA